MKKKILLTNDDGSESVYTKLLSQYLKHYYDVFEFIPQNNQSGLSGSLSRVPIKIDKISTNKYILSGTPVECVIFGVELMKQYLSTLPTIIISGPNNGLNYGKTSFYSGTFMAANEGFQSSINSISISIQGNFDANFFKWLSGLIFLIESVGKLDGLLNININNGNNNVDKFDVIRERNIIEHNFSLFELSKVNLQFQFNKKDIDDSNKPSFISVAYYFDSNSENKEKKLINLIKKYIRRKNF